MRPLLVTIFGAALALGASGCGDKPSKDDCEKLLHHVVDLEVAAGGGGQLPDNMKEDIEGQKAALKDAVKKDFMRKCTKETPGALVACGLKATSLDDLAACEKQE